MTWHHEESSSLQKLSGFFPTVSRRLQQDGGGGLLVATSYLCQGAAADPRGCNEEDSCSPSFSPSTRSPAKSWPRWDFDPTVNLGPSMEVCATTHQSCSENDHSEPFDSFPASGQPVSDTVLKDMLLSLCSSLQADMLECFCKYSAEVQELEDRLSHLEYNMSACITSYNAMVDTHVQHGDDIA